MKKLFLLLFAMCFMALSAYADRTISGQVVDAATGEPLIGATIHGEGVNQGTAPDVNGNFTLVLPDHVKYVNVSYIGFATRQIEVANNMVVKLTDSGQSLDEVVVVAYGSAKRQSSTGSISVVDEKKIKDRATAKDMDLEDMEGVEDDDALDPLDGLGLDGEDPLDIRMLELGENEE